MPRIFVIPSGSERSADKGIVVILKYRSDEFIFLYQLLPEYTLDAFHIWGPIPYVQSGLSVTSKYPVSLNKVARVMKFVPSLVT